MSPGPPRPPSPWLLLPLLVVAGTTNPPPQRVIGVLGGSVLLSPLLSPNKTLKKIEWSFLGSTGDTITVAEFGPDGCKRPDPEDQFKNRLEMLNWTTLKIEPLELGDSGVYGARITLDPELLMDQSFILSVYGPLGQLKIQSRLRSLTTHGCNLTLGCRLPAGNDAEVTWEPRPPWGHLCGDNQTLCLAVPTSAFNSTITCTAQNPIEKKNISIQLDTLCQPKETQGWKRWHLWLVVVGVAAGALLGGVWLWRKKRRRRRKKRAEGAPLAPPSNEDALPYAEIQRRTPPEEDEQREHPTTVYSQVQAGGGRGGEVLA